MEPARLSNVLQKDDGILLEGWTDSPLSLDKFGRIIDSNRLGSIRGSDHQADHEVNQSATLEGLPTPRIVIRIHIVYEALHEDLLRLAIVHVAKAMMRRERIVCCIHFGSSLPDIGFVRDFVRLIRKCQEKSRRCHFVLSGHFCDTHANEIIELFDYGVNLQFVVGWWPGCPPDMYVSLQSELLRQIAELGYRIPLRCYVHKENVRQIANAIPDGLRANYESGFSLPLICSSPFYVSKHSENPNPPNSEDYLELLVHSFENYRQHDDVMEPIVELTETVVHGGWHGVLDVPTRINLLVKPGAGFGVYLQLPEYAIPWLNARDITSCDIDDLFDDLLDFYKKTFAWDKNGFCNKCPWRHICGGLDYVEERLKSITTPYETVCNHRLFFLQFLTHLKYREHLANPTRP